jgi:hypothetical protein
MANKHDVSINLRADNSNLARKVAETDNLIENFFRKVGKRGQFLRLDTSALSRDLDRVLQSAGRKPLKISVSASASTAPVKSETTRRAVKAIPDSIPQDKPISYLKQIRAEYRKQQQAQKEAIAEAASLTTQQLKNRVKKGAQNIAMPEPSDQANWSARMKASVAEKELAKRGVVAANALSQAFDFLTAQASGNAKTQKISPAEANKRLESLYLENPDKRPVKEAPVVPESKPTPVVITNDRPEPKIITGPPKPVTPEGYTPRTPPALGKGKYDDLFVFPKLDSVSPEEGRKMLLDYAKRLDEFVSKFESSGKVSPNIIQRAKDRLSGVEQQLIDSDPEIIAEREQAEADKKSGVKKAPKPVIPTVEPAVVPPVSVPIDINEEEFDTELTAALDRARTILENKLVRAANARTMALKFEAQGDVVKSANYNKTAERVDKSAKSTYDSAVNKAFESFRKRKAKEGSPIDDAKTANSLTILGRGLSKILSSAGKTLSLAIPDLGGGKLKHASNLFDTESLTRGFDKVGVSAKTMAFSVAGGVAIAEGALKLLEKAIENVREVWGTGIAEEKAEFNYEKVVGDPAKIKKMVKQIKELSKGMFSETEIFEVATKLDVQTLGAMNSPQGMKLIGDAAAATENSLTDTGDAIGAIYQAAQRNDMGSMEGHIERLRLMGIVSAETRDKYFYMLRTGADGGAMWGMLNEEIAKHAGALGKLPETYSGMKSAISAKFEDLWAGFTRPLQAALKPMLGEFFQSIESLRPIMNELAQWVADKLAWVSGNISKIIKNVRDKIEWVKAAINLKDSIGNPLAWELLKAYAAGAAESIKNGLTSALIIAAEVGSKALITYGVHAAKIIAAAYSKATDPKYGKGITDSYNPVRTVWDLITVDALENQLKYAIQQRNEGKISDEQLDAERKRVEGIIERRKLDQDPMSWDLDTALADAKKEIGEVQGVESPTNTLDFSVSDETTNLIESIKKQIKDAADKVSNKKPPEIKFDSEDKDDSKQPYKRDMNYAMMGKAIGDSLQKVGGGGNYSGFISIDQKILDENKKHTGWLQIIAGQGGVDKETVNAMGGKGKASGNTPNKAAKEGHSYPVAPKDKTTAASEEKPAADTPEVANNKAAGTLMLNYVKRDRAAFLAEQRKRSESTGVLVPSATGNMLREKYDKWDEMTRKANILKSGVSIDPKLEAQREGGSAKIDQGEAMLRVVGDKRTAALASGEKLDYNALSAEKEKAYALIREGNEDIASANQEYRNRATGKTAEVKPNDTAQVAATVTVEDQNEKRAEEIKAAEARKQEALDKIKFLKEEIGPRSGTVNTFYTKDDGGKTKEQNNQNLANSWRNKTGADKELGPTMADAMELNLSDPKAGIEQYIKEQERIVAEQDKILATPKPKSTAQTTATVQPENSNGVTPSMTNSSVASNDPAIIELKNLASIMTDIKTILQSSNKPGSDLGASRPMVSMA